MTNMPTTINAVVRNADISKRRCQIFRGQPGGKNDLRIFIGFRLNFLIRTFNLFGRGGLPEPLLQLQRVHLHGENRRTDNQKNRKSQEGD